MRDKTVKDTLNPRSPPRDIYTLTPIFYNTLINPSHCDHHHKVLETRHRHRNLHLTLPQSHFKVSLDGQNLSSQWFSNILQASRLVIGTARCLLTSLVFRKRYVMLY